MNSVTRTYQIEAPLNIAFGWVNKALPKHIVTETSLGNVGLDLERGSKLNPELAEAHIGLWVKRVNLRLGLWYVTALRSGHSVWLSKRSEAHVEADGTIYTHHTSPPREKCVEPLIKRRLHQLRRGIGEVGGMVIPVLTCKLEAVSSNETLAAVHTYDCYEQAVFRLEAHLARRAKLVELLRGQEGEPTDPWLRTWLAQDELNQHLLDMLKDPNMPYERIAESLYVSVDTVQRVAKGLQERGYIPRRKRGRKRGL